MKKYFALVLMAVLLLPIFSSCSPAPRLEDVKDEFIALFEESYYINDIIFGKGLVTEYDLSSTKIEYTDEVKSSEEWFTDEQIFFYYYSPVVSSYDKDTDGDGVADTTVNQPTTVKEIKELCEKVYSKDYLKSVYRVIFSENYNDRLDASLKTVARYRDSFINDEYDIGTDEDKLPNVETKEALRRYIFVDGNGMNFIDFRGGRTVYDYDTMKIHRASNGNTVYVEIMAYFQHSIKNEATGKYEKRNEWEEIRITFIRTDDGWRLGSPTY